MDSRKTKKVIAVAISPKYAHAILSGKKSVEFRRNGTPTDILYIVLYSTNPEQKIIGYCEVNSCVVEPTQVLWRDFGKYGFIDEDAFNDYYKGQDTGKCYLITKSFKFTRPVSLSNCKSFTSAPQSFVYMKKTEWRNLKRKKKISTYNGVQRI